MSCNSQTKFTTKNTLENAAPRIGTNSRKRMQVAVWLCSHSEAEGCSQPVQSEQHEADEKTSEANNGKQLCRSHALASSNNFAAMAREADVPSVLLEQIHHLETEDLPPPLPNPKVPAIIPQNVFFSTFLVPFFDMFLRSRAGGRSSVSRSWVSAGWHLGQTEVKTSFSKQGSKPLEERARPMPIAANVFGPGNFCSS
eukprot:2929985-Amphidinium_carterae.1